MDAWSQREYLYEPHKRVKAAFYLLFAVIQKIKLKIYALFST
jgi:hypothetical protein